MSNPSHTTRVHAMWHLFQERGADAFRLAVTQMRSGDIQQLLRELPSAQAVTLFRALPYHLQTESLEDLPPELRDDCLHAMSNHEVVSMLSAAATDDAVYFLDQLEKERVHSILALLDEHLHEHISGQYHLPEDCAGRLMSTKLSTLPTYLTVEQALQKLRDMHDGHEGCLYIVDPAGHLSGIVTYRQLALADPETLISTIMDTKVISVDIASEESDVPPIMVDHNISAIPVTKDDNILCGIINWDDAAELMEAEADEDLLAIAGTAENFEDNDSALRRASLRLPYLLITLCGGFIMASMIDAQVERIHHYTLLMAMIPLVPAIAGNVGIQCSTVCLRYIVTGNISPERIRSRIVREIKTGFILACTIAMLTGLCVFAYIYYQGYQPLLGVAITIAMLIAIVLAAIFGTFVPLLCDKMGIDPAIAAGPFITMLNDIVGVGVYLVTVILFIQLL